MKHTGSIRGYKPLKQTTKQPNPYLEASHSKKPIREFDSISMYNLAQPQKLYTNEVFNFWKANTPPLKASLFLSFHIVQKMKSGMDFHTFFLFLPTKEPLKLFYCLTRTDFICLSSNFFMFHFVVISIMVNIALIWSLMHAIYCLIFSRGMTALL